MMTSDRTPDPAAKSPAEAAPEDETRSLLRAHAMRPPYDAVHWDALAARIMAQAEADLGRRRSVRELVGVTGLRRGVRAWWEVTAQWARPAVAAALAAIAVAAALVGTAPASSGTLAAADSAASGIATNGVTANTDPVDAVLGSSTNTTVSSEARVVTRDSLFSALVDGR